MSCEFFFYNLTAKETLKKLETTTEGLSKQESEKRIKKYGKNELIVEIKSPAWLMFLSQFKEVLVLVLIVAGIISFAIGSFRDGIVMFVIVILNAIIGFIQEYKAEKIIDQLKELINSPAKILRNNETVEIPQGDLVPGDIVILEEGDKVPADIRILKSFNLRTNDFSLTGESLPQEKHSNALDGDLPIGDRENMAYVGTTVAIGNAKGVVVATAMDTELGKIADMTSKTEQSESPLQKELGILGNKLTFIVVLLSIALFFVALKQGFEIYVSLVYALGIAVAAVPQALPAQVTVALSTASKRLADRKAVVKELPSVETLGSTNIICTDKTGTLTKNEMTARAVWFNSKYYTVSGIGYEPKGEMLDENNKSLEQKEIDELEIMLDAATMASNAEIHEPDEKHDSWYPIGDPTEAALITLSTKMGTRSPEEDIENPELHEFPFDSERKRMSSIRQFGDKKVLTMKGALDSVLSITKLIHKTKYIYKNGKAQPITEQDKNNIREVSEKYAQEAMRVLAVAYRPLELDGEDYVIDEIEKDVIFLGLVGMTDPPKEGVKEAMRDAHRAHIRTIIMTGDHAITAQAIGREIGLSTTGDISPVITGQELHKMSDEELSNLLIKEDSIIFSRVDPKDKLRIVETLKGQDKIVAVTGDGVNDAPALKMAHIGVAMGKTGTDVAKESAELVLLDDSFSTLVYAVQEGRTIYNNLKKTIIASMTTNAAELAIVLMGLAAVSLWGWAIPLLAIQILAIDLVAEILPLTFLTFDPPSEEIMNSPPRDRKKQILNRYMSAEILFFGVLIGVLAFMNFALFMHREGITLTMDHVDTIMYARATTITWVTIAFCQFANILSRRYNYSSLFNKNFFSNKKLLSVILLSIGFVMLGVYGPYIHEFLSFASLSIVDWLYILMSTAIFLIAFEVMKILKRWKYKKSNQKN